jgi:hypothetical protein
MSQGNSGLPFLSIGLGVILASATAGAMSKLYLKRKAARDGIGCTEDRLVFAIAAVIVAPASIF